MNSPVGFNSPSSSSRSLRSRNRSGFTSCACLTPTAKPARPRAETFERITYRLLGVDAGKEHNWKQYTFAMLLFSLVSCVFTYAILRLQHLLPFNPQGLGPL